MWFWFRMSSRLRSKEREISSSAPSTPSQFIYIDYELDTKSETLHTISIKFGVSISDLKRFNSLQNDRDIYALKYLKIPIKPHSYQSELYASQLKYSETVLTRLKNGDFEPVEQPLETASQIDLDSTHSAEISETDDTTALLIEPTTAPTTSSNHQSREAKKYLKRFDTKLESLINQNQEILTEVKNKHTPNELFTISNISYSVESRSSPSHLFKSSNFKPNTRDVLIIALIFVIVLPTIIFIYRYVYINEHEHHPWFNLKKSIFIIYFFVLLDNDV